MRSRRRREFFHVELDDAFGVYSAQLFDEGRGFADTLSSRTIGDDEVGQNAH